VALPISFAVDELQRFDERLNRGSSVWCHSHTARLESWFEHRSHRTIIWDGQRNSEKNCLSVSTTPISSHYIGRSIDSKKTTNKCQDRILLEMSISVPQVWLVGRMLFWNSLWSEAKFVSVDNTSEVISCCVFWTVWTSFLPLLHSFRRSWRLSGIAGDAECGRLGGESKWANTNSCTCRGEKGIACLVGCALRLAACFSRMICFPITLINCIQ
jgi:hypothetical protein